MENRDRSSFDRGKLITEQSNESSLSLHTMSTKNIVELFSKEDMMPQLAVSEALSEISHAVDMIHARMKLNGRLIYIGAGTSGRLGVLDAAECPPTFCSDPEMIQGIIAGGFSSLVNSSEGLEDNHNLAIEDLTRIKLSPIDSLVGISAGGTTPYVHSAIDYANKLEALSISISCVPLTQVSFSSNIDIRLITGPEILSGSTRLKAGTATKMALNIISTAVMIKMGKVYHNKMIDLKVSNNKLEDRAIRILVDILKINRDEAHELLVQAHGSVKIAIFMNLTSTDYNKAFNTLAKFQGDLTESLKA